MKSKLTFAANICISTILFSSLISLTCYSQSSVPFVAKPSNNRNYKAATTFNIPGVKTPAQVIETGRSTKDVSQVIEYQDGLGRSIQTVVPQSSPSGKDVILPSAFDHAGRQPKKYMPYTINSDMAGNYRADALAGTGGYSGSEQFLFYQQTGQNLTNTLYPYAETVLDPVVMNRAEKGAVGAQWQPQSGSIPGSGHTIKQDISFSKASDEIKDWVYLGNRMEVSSNQNKIGLTKTITRNENWTSGKAGTEEVYTDLKGRIIAKKVYETETSPILTYYIYDDNIVNQSEAIYNGKGNLRYVLTPGVAVATIYENDTVFNKYVYAYHYDERNRLVEKKMPGVGWSFTVYNTLDLPVLSQDHVERINQEWTYVKYDAMSRIVMTGRYIRSGTRTALQTLVNNNLVNFENRDKLGTNGYTSLAFPAGNGAEVYNVNYYDDYDLPTSSPWAAPEVGYTQMVSGLPTAKLTKILNTSTYLWTVNYYDEEAQIIGTKSQNHLGGVDEVSVNYDFSGTIDSMIRKSTVNSVTTKIKESYIYDNQGRLLKTKQKINDEPEIVLAAYAYNELGQLINKKLHSIDLGENYLQSIDYKYNVMGWLTSINDINISASNNTKFGQQLAYENSPVPMYNGNVGQSKWKTARTLTSPQLGFDFQYDNLNRLSAAVSSTEAVKDQNYSEYLTYDQMGNIKTLGRYALTGTPATRQQIDSLSYTYDSNRHIRIDDISTSLSKDLGFNDKVQVPNEYVYDGKGRLISDQNLGINSIVYNIADQPSEVIFTGAIARKLEIKYNSSGEKLQQKYTNGANISTTDYIGGIQYASVGTGVAQLKFIQTPEGRARFNGTKFVYEYDLKDNLGNVRVTIDADPSDLTQKTARVLQENSYYPFGMVMPNVDINYLSGDKNNYLYNGKEFQEALGQLDYGARFYDPAIGRWSVNDPLGEMYYDQSGYSYGMNNPIRYTDPTGMTARDTVWGNVFDPDDHYDVNIKAHKGDLRTGSSSFNGNYLSNLLGAIGSLNSYDFSKDNDKEREAAARAYRQAVAAFNRLQDQKQFIVDNYGKSVDQEENRQVPPGGGASSSWYEIGSKVNAVVGAVATGAGYSDANVKVALNISTKYLKANFAKTMQIGKIARVVGVAGYMAGTAMDFIALRKGLIGGGKFTTNFVIGAVGLTEGAPLAVMYFGMDAFYPGGVNGFKDDLSKYGSEVKSQTINGFRNYNFSHW